MSDVLPQIYKGHYHLHVNQCLICTNQHHLDMMHLFYLFGYNHAFTNKRLMNI